MVHTAYSTWCVFSVHNSVCIWQVKNGMCMFQYDAAAVGVCDCTDTGYEGDRCDEGGQCYSAINVGRNPPPLDFGL